MRADPKTPAASEPDGLQVSIAREAAATETMLNDAFRDDEAGSRLDSGAFRDDGAGSGLAAGSGLPGREELRRQLAVLRERVRRAAAAPEDPNEVRAELATLLFFARTLRADAEAWRAGLREAVAELERRETAVRRERERLAAERADLLRRRQALQGKIDREAGRIAHRKRGECRRTLPVITLDPGLTVSSMTVSSARRRFRSAKLWLVTLDEARRDILVRGA